MHLLLPLALWASLTARAGTTTWPDLSTLPSASAGDGSKDAALVVGIEAYDKVDQVLGARDNADDWYRWLVKARGVPLDRVHRLTDGQAVDHKIRSELAAAVAEVRPGGTLWVVFIGHGAPSRDGRDGLLVGADADRSADGIYGRSIARSEVLSTIDHGTPGQAVLVLDTCFSGQGQTGMALADGLQPLVPTSARVSSGRVTVLTATGSGEFAGRLPGTARPAFSYLALGALRGWADSDGNGTVSASEVAAYTRGALKATVHDRTQTPGLDGPDLALARGREQGPDLVELAVAEPSVPVSVGAATIDLGGRATDFAALAAQAQAATETKRRVDAAAAAAQQALASEQRRQLDEAAATVRSQATRDYAALGALVDAPSDEGRPVLQAYVDRYGAAKVTVGDASEAVSVPEVARVEAALQAIQAARSAAPGRGSEVLDLEGYLQEAPPSEADRAAAREKRSEAIATVSELLPNASPVGSQKAGLLMRLADLYFEGGRDLSETGAQEDAVRWLESSVAWSDRVLKEFPTGPLADQALYAKARAQRALSLHDDAVNTLAQLARTFQESPLLPDAHVQFGEYYFNRNEVAKALTAYKRATAYQDSELVAFANYKLAWCYHLVGEPDQAIAGMKGVISSLSATSTDASDRRLREQATRDLDFFRTQTP